MRGKSVLLAKMGGKLVLCRIFSDVTSAQMATVRGKRRAWRMKDETYHPHVVTRRWKGFSDFMW
jgi:hypothetical protein